MEKLKTLNIEHKEIIKAFTIKVDEFIYDITDEHPVKMFQNFIPLKEKAILLHNMIGRDIEDKLDNRGVSINEWVFMLPNFLLFGAVGFSAALKDKQNNIEIDELCDQLFINMTNIITDLNEMLEDHLLEEDALDNITNILNTKNNKLKTND